MTHVRVLNASDIEDRFGSNGTRELTGAAIVRPLVEHALGTAQAVLGQSSRSFKLIVPSGDGRIDLYAGADEGYRRNSSDRVRPVTSEAITLDQACALIGGCLGYRDSITLVPLTKVEKHYLRR